MDFLRPFIEQVQEISAAYGSELRPKFRVCDTMGVGLPYEDVTLPRSIPRISWKMRKLGLRPADLEFHPHNDSWLVVANCLAAVRAGCNVINGISLGKGERTGNAPLEAILMHLIGMGYFREKRPDFTALNALVELYAEMNEPVPPKYPLMAETRIAPASVSMLTVSTNSGGCTRPSMFRNCLAGRLRYR